jgi:hypothetical protein
MYVRERAPSDSKKRIICYKQRRKRHAKINQPNVNKPAGRQDGEIRFVFELRAVDVLAKKNGWKPTKMVEPIDRCVKLFIDIKAQQYKERERERLPWRDYKSTCAEHWSLLNTLRWTPSR